MFDLIKNILFIIAGIFTVTWLISSTGGWQELAEKYRTEPNLPETFLVTENEQITFKRENNKVDDAIALFDDLKKKPAGNFQNYPGKHKFRIPDYQLYQELGICIG